MQEARRSRRVYAGPSDLVIISNLSTTTLRSWLFLHDGPFGPHESLMSLVCYYLRTPSWCFRRLFSVFAGHAGGVCTGGPLLDTALTGLLSFAVFYFRFSLTVLSRRS
jgi:hypothetical protein